MKQTALTVTGSSAERCSEKMRPRKMRPTIIGRSQANLSENIDQVAVKSTFGGALLEPALEPQSAAAGSPLVSFQILTEPVSLSSRLPTIKVIPATIIG